MKKSFVLFAFAAFLASQAFATYIVVLKDGTKYKAKAKWTISNGKALVNLENGQTIAINPSDIDLPKSEQVTKLGLGDVNVIAMNSPSNAAQAAPKEQPSLGQVAHIRRPVSGATSAPAPVKEPVASAPVAPVAALTDELDPRLKDNFERAYENVGIFEHKLTGTNRSVRAELTADSEDKVFNAISATAFLIVRNAGLDNQQIDMVELFMKTTTGGAAGRFQMNRADADAINSKSISLPDYFVRKVIY